jgi:hypothetical protein
MAGDEWATPEEIQEVVDQAKREAADKARRSGLILPPSASPLRREDTGVHSLIDLYDTELKAIDEQVLPPLANQTGKTFLADDWPTRRDSFEREVVGRFSEIGIVAKVVGWYVDPDDPLDNAPTPRIEIQGRTERIEFDHDRMVSEVTSDVLGLGDSGVIH